MKAEPLPESTPISARRHRRGKFGLLGVLTPIVMFFWLTRRIMHIGRQAIAPDRVSSGLVAQGIGLWVGFQSFINMG